MKKKITALMLVAVLALTAIGGTLAYFTDTDAAVNVMTIGNVDIKQHEEERDTVNGGLKDFTQNQKLFPAVYEKLEKDGKIAFPNGENVALWDKSINNELDKIVSVTNVGSEDAYVRTILAFETQRHYKEGSSTEFTDLHDIYFGVNGDFDYLNEYITIDGVEYVLAVKVYEDALAKDERSAPSLKQIFLAPTANNETTQWFGNEYNILALSQAVQAEGFDNAEAALNTAFGEVTAENAQAWFNK